MLGPGDLQSIPLKKQNKETNSSLGILKFPKNQF